MIHKRIYLLFLLSIYALTLHKSASAYYLQKVIGGICLLVGLCAIGGGGCLTVNNLGIYSIKPLSETTAQIKMNVNTPKVMPCIIIISLGVYILATGFYNLFARPKTFYQQNSAIKDLL